MELLLSEKKLKTPVLFSLERRLRTERIKVYKIIKVVDNINWRTVILQLLE